MTPLDYEDGNYVEPGAKSPFPENAHHAINSRLLQIRDSSYLFDSIEFLRRGFDKRNSVVWGSEVRLSHICGVQSQMLSVLLIPGYWRSQIVHRISSSRRKPHPLNGNTHCAHCAPNQFVSDGFYGKSGCWYSTFLNVSCICWLCWGVELVMKISLGPKEWLVMHHLAILTWLWTNVIYILWCFFVFDEISLPSINLL